MTVDRREACQKASQITTGMGNRHASDVENDGRSGAAAVLPGNWSKNATTFVTL